MKRGAGQSIAETALPGGVTALAALALAGLALAALAAQWLVQGPDAERGRLCRMLLPALYPEDEGIQVIASTAETAASVRITFRTGGLRGREHAAICRFGGEGHSAAKRDLVAVTLDGAQLGEATLYFLKERWLESSFALAADPGPPRRADASRLRQDSMPARPPSHEGKGG